MGGSSRRVVMRTGIRVRAAARERCRRRGRGASGRRPTPRRAPIRPLHPEVQVVLDRVADRAVALQRLAGDELGGIGGEALGHRDVARRRRQPVLHGIRGAVDDRAGELEGEQRVGEVVLDRLEAADRHPELLALLHVVDGCLQQAIGEPDELRRRAERAVVERHGQRGLRLVALGEHELGRRAGLDREEPAAAVDRGLGRHGEVVAGDGHDAAVVLEDQQPGDLRVRHERGPTERGRGDEPAGRDAGQPRVDRPGRRRRRGQ